MKNLFKKLVIRFKLWYSQYQDWKYGIEIQNYYYRKLKLGEILKDGDILQEGYDSGIPLIIGNPRCKIAAGTVIDQYLFTFRPTRKEFINGHKDI